MRHPDLPDNLPIEVAASAVPQHRAGGWFEVDPPPPPKPPKDEADGDKPRGAGKTPPRRPSASKEKD